MAAERVRNRAELLALLGRLTNYERQPDFHAGRVRIDLSRMERFCAALGRPERAAPVVHVTGTKGKGSTATLVARVLAEHGRRVGLHTSPHLEWLGERVRVDGAPAADDDLVDATNEILAVTPDDTPDAFPTFFEWVTLAAFLVFRRRGVDVAVHEVGLGGRLDATNVVRPAVTVLTNVDLEHTRILGDTVAEIAAEKAGIVKPGAPVVTGVPAGSPADGPLVAAAAAARAPILRLGEEIEVARTAASASWTTVDVTLEGRRLSGLVTRLHGAPQETNVALALAAADALLRAAGEALDEGAARRALAALVLPARLERVREAPPVFLDGAHTAASLTAALDAVRRLAEGRVVVVWAMAEDKDLDGGARAVAAADAVVATRYDHPRAAAPDDLAARVRAAGGAAEVGEDPEFALDRALLLAERGGLVLVTGSLYLAGAVRRLVGPIGGDRWST